MIPMLTAHGAKIPTVGFGTSQLGAKQPGDFTDAVAAALKLGYRHIDTAWKYGSEPAVGKGIKKSGVPRQEIFLTTKVSHEYLRAADFARSVEESLSHLQTDYVDLLLVHWPTIDNIPLEETMGALARAKREGKTRFIGVANFNIALLDEAMRLCPEQFSVLQAEYHPYLEQTKMLAHCRSKGLIFMAYCPLARGGIFNDPVLTDIARAKGRTIAQVALRWLIQQDIVAPIPRSSDAKHMAESLDVFNFTLNDEEMQRIYALKRPDGRIANPAGRAPAWD